MPTCATWCPRIVSRAGAWLGCLALVLVACARPSATPSVRPTATAPRAADARAGERAPRGKPVLLRGGRVMTATGVVYEKGDVLLVGSRIAGVGARIDDAPADTTIVDVTGKTITPGLIDTHSHLGVYAAPSLRAHEDGNEAVAATTP
ncbi:MAG TPA: hypothetical protein VFG69_18795, partial [Nannocystaceae bacterium]|nr:hypothetical protein [Nannocystaceae bacterium]